MSMTTAILKYQGQGAKDDQQLAKAIQWLAVSTDPNQVLLFWGTHIIKFAVFSWRNYYVSTNPALGLYSNSKSFVILQLLEV